jgi:hypothetical protein
MIPIIGTTKFKARTVLDSFENLSLNYSGQGYELLYILLSYLDRDLSIDGFPAQKACQNAECDVLTTIIMKSSTF